MTTTSVGRLAPPRPTAALIDFDILRPSGSCLKLYTDFHARGNADDDYKVRRSPVKLEFGLIRMGMPKTQ